MGDVIEIDFDSRNDSFEYFRYGEKGLIGIESKDMDIEVFPHENMFIANGTEFHFSSRAEMAKFFYAVAIFLDSEQRFVNGNFPAMNYE